MLQPQKFTTVAQQPSRTLALTSDALRCSTSEARAKARAFVLFACSEGVFGVVSGFAHTVGGADFPYPKETLNHD